MPSKPDKHDKEYQEILDAKSVIANEFPDLIKLLQDDDITITISEKMKKALLNYLRLNDDEHIAAIRGVYYRGLKDGFIYLKHIVSEK